MIALNALAIRAGGAAVRVHQVANRAPALWQTSVLLLRNRGVGIDIDAAPDLLVDGWPPPLEGLALPRRLFESRVIRRRCRDHSVSALLHYGTFVPMRGLPGVLNVLCFISLAPWDSGPSRHTLRNRTLRGLFEHTRSRADVVVVQSQATREFLQRLYPDLASRLVVVVNGLAVPPLVRPGRPRGFLLLGHVHEYRRIDVVVRAYATLDPVLREKHPLIIAGHAGLDRAAGASLEAALKVGNVASHVHRLGPVPRTRALQLMAEAAAFVSYATVENGPNALCEARAAGAPLILSDLAVHREFGGEGAIYAADTDALAAALRDVAVAPDADTTDYRPAVDSWDDHVRALGAVLVRHGALHAPPRGPTSVRA